MPHHLLECLSLFVTAPAGFTICIQLLGAGYEYSVHLLRDARRKPVVRELTVQGPNAHPCRASTQGPISPHEWLTGPQHCNSFTTLHICDEKSPIVLPLISSSFLFHPNLLLWVSAHGVLNPSVSNSCWGQRGMGRLNESLQPPKGFPHASLFLVPASVFDPLCFSNPVDSYWVQGGSYTCQPTYRPL